MVFLQGDFSSSSGWSANTLFDSVDARPASAVVPIIFLREMEKEGIFMMNIIGCYLNFKINI